MSQPIILFTNDDGIESPGLWAAVKAFEGLGKLLVVAPREQQSGMGRSLPVFSEGRIYPWNNNQHHDCIAYAVDGTPAQAVQHGVLELADELPALVVSGINYGDNTGNGVTISGTVGAAIEAASLGIPALAVSQQTRHDLHLTYSSDVDFSIAAHFAQIFGKWLLDNQERPDDIDLLKLDVPLNATIETPWKVTRLSRRRVYWPTRPERATLKDVGRLGYKYDTDPAKAEPDSDVYTVLHEGLVSITPISLDMTSRTDLFRLRQLLTGERQYGRVKKR
ncbi:MAG: 5'/3'-nucleotidase SurE [Phototrophicales bacterium]|nr:MAG: 5'/3'-nucleotidase SurE [Phototrophicales bacterium]RMG70260.1 MAG: 5'/3'-nucleotidase SurE [Chloroflexota bacterium]